MALAAGTRLGPYEVVSPIGAGGMGEVYQARDTRLDRSVAIKILPDLLASDPEFRARFDREARTLSQLTHPHICTLHDVGEHDGTAFLVMELLSGETLARRLERGPMPPGEAMVTAIEIAAALDAAHRAGVVHRDLKPGNVMRTREGAKLLDFGLSKRPAGQQPMAALTAAVTARTPLTGQGSILGTLQYMAPEQLEGREADARTDIFAFGACLYEMVTGRRPFEAASQASMIGAILKDTPPPIPATSKAPRALDRIIRTCLAKDPDDRWQSAGDLKRELKWVAENATAEDGPTQATPRRLSLIGGRLGWGIAGLLAGGLAAGLILWRTAQPGVPAPARSTHLTMVLPPDAMLNVRANQPSLAISPDGSRLAYVAERGSGSQLYLRALDQREARPIPGTEGAWSPFFSPDGQWVGFSAGGKLKKVSLTGGTPITICDGGDDSGTIWRQDDLITFSSNAGLVQVSAAGGTPRPLTTLDAQRKETAHLWPDMLPGGEAVLFTAWTGGSFDDAPIAVQSLKTGERRPLGIKGTFPRYAPTGHVIYARAGSLMAAPFDLTRLEVTGPPVQILDGVMVHPPSGAAQFAFSQNGSLVYVAAPAAADRTMVWVDRRGIVQPLTGPEHAFLFPRLSPDDRHVVFASGEGIADLWLFEIGRGTFTRLTLDRGNYNIRPIWTPDGTRITFTSSSAGPMNLFWMPADGSGPAERLFASPYTQFPSAWSPDGRHLGFMEIHPDTGWDLWVLPRDDRAKPLPFLQTPFNEGWLEFSPDGRWVAYTGNESGRWQVYVRPFPGPGGKVQISSDGGTEAVWSRGGRELFYRDGEKMMAVTVGMTPTFSAGRPRLLFEGRYERGPVAGMVNYDVSRDGQRFLMLKNQRAATPPELEVVVDWFAEVARRVPRP